MALVGYRNWAVTDAGDTIGASAVEVRRKSDNSLADLFTDAGGGTGVVNPFTADADGSFEFYADGGLYDLLVGTGPSQETTPLSLIDADGNIAFASRADAEAWRATGGTLDDGQSFSADGLMYKWEAGSTLLPGLPDIVAIDPTVPHFMLSTDVDSGNAAFIAIAAGLTGVHIDLEGATYEADTMPSTNFFYNGYITHTTDGYTFDANRSRFGRVQNSQVALGRDCGTAWPNWPKDNIQATSDTVAIGSQCLSAQTTGRNSIAIGNKNLEKSVASQHNIGIGLNSVRWANNTDSFATDEGTRNVGLGSTTLAFVEGGARNVAVGRNSGQTVMGTGNSSFGPTANGGYAPTTWDGNNIHNSSPLTADYGVGVGFQAGQFSNKDYNICMGYQAGQNAGLNELLAIGKGAGKNIGSTQGCNGNTLVTGASLNGTYVVSASTIGHKATCTLTSHGLSDGFVVYVTMTPTAESAYAEHRMVVSGATANTFVLENKYCDDEPTTLVGAFAITEYINNTPATVTAGNLAIGLGAMDNTVAPGQYNTTVGTNSLQDVTGQFNSAFGYRALQDVTTGDENTGLGKDAGRNITTGSGNTAVGKGALPGIVTADDNTALGIGALAGLVTYTNSTGVGANAVVAGSNEVQLGDSATTTYAYGAVQNRSDERDKADIQDTILGLTFINSLRPVDFRWDYREDYDSEKDGSKKRTRFHHGLIAQELRDTMTSLGVDFGGFQDHAIGGGEDVLTVGYEELIGPLIKAIQQLSSRVEELENTNSN